MPVTACVPETGARSVVSPNEPPPRQSAAAVNAPSAATVPTSQTSCSVSPLSVSIRSESVSASPIELPDGAASEGEKRIAAVGVKPTISNGNAPEAINSTTGFRAPKSGEDFTSN